MQLYRFKVLTGCLPKATRFFRGRAIGGWLKAVRADLGAGLLPLERVDVLNNTFSDPAFAEEFTSKATRAWAGGYLTETARFHRHMNECVAFKLLHGRLPYSNVHSYEAGHEERQLGIWIRGLRESLQDKRLPEHR